MTTLRARVVAAPAAELKAQRGRVLGAGSSAVYVQLGDRVAAITARGVPLMPNGISVDAPELPKAAPGTDVVFSIAEVAYGDTTVQLEGAEMWSPAVPNNSGRTAAEVARRGRGVLRNCRVSPAVDPDPMAESLAASGLESAREPGGRKGVTALLTSLSSRDPSAAEEACSLLMGRGSGLTPEGDDLVGGAVATIRAFGAAAGLGAETQARLLGALCPPDVRERTTLLSATLLELATEGMVIEPMLPMLNLNEPPDTWRPALRRLLAIGHTTGRAWALGSAAGAAMLGRKEASE